jgi:hypothetical protein
MNSCSKCGYESEENKLIEEEKYLCSICNQFAPSKEKLNDYLSEKIDYKHLESFRKFSGKNLHGMKEKASQGKIMSRPALGYKLVNKELVIDEEKKLMVQQVFLDFLNSDSSLSALSLKYNISINGLKKVLRNFTYLGKTKFAGQILQGNHQAIISSELFNKVQSKLESLGIR